MAVNLEPVREKFGGTAKIPAGTVAALRDDSNKRTFAMDREGSWSADQLEGLNDNIERLWVAEGWELEVFEHSGLRGWSHKYHSPPLNRVTGDLDMIWDQPRCEGGTSVRLKNLGYTRADVVLAQYLSLIHISEPTRPY